VDGDIPAGRYFCRRCFGERDFIVADGATAEDRDPPIECYVCGFTYSKIYLEVDPMTGHEIAPNLAVRSAMPQAQREIARGRLREEFRATAIVDGYRLENFTRPRRRSGDES